MKINVKEVGVGDPINPYDRNADLEENEKWKDFAKEYKQQPALFPDGNLLPVGQYEVDLEHQGLYGTLWLKITENAYKWFNENQTGYQFSKVREVYIGSVAPESKEANRDWIEDLSHENGNYMCHCGVCGNTFNGHKRRVRCKVCATVNQPEKEVDTIEQWAEEKYTELLREDLIDMGVPVTENFMETCDTGKLHWFKKGAHLGANHIKSTHVPIEEVISILHYEMTKADRDYLNKLDNIITLVKQLIKPQ